MLLRGQSTSHSSIISRLLLSVVFASLTIGGLTALLSFSTKNFSLTEVSASPPQIINYQAKVTDSSGVTVTDGSYAIKFKLYDASTSGNCLYVASGTCASPTSVTTTITSGVFSVLLGDTSAGFNTLTTSSLVSSSVYLGVTIGTDSEMSPRKRLVASPYAINSLTLNNMDAQTNGGTSSYILAANSTGNLTITGTGTSTFSQGATFATSGGQVGIGTSTPNYKLEVNGDISAATGIRDGLGWNQNQANVARNSLGTNNGGFGGGATPGNIITTSTDVSFFDTAPVNSDAKGFYGGVFDGRYVYFVPRSHPGRSGLIARYDTAGSFSTTSSYSFFDASSVNANSREFQTAVFDGRYIYFIPLTKSGSSNGQITRYDTIEPFTTVASWSVFDTATVNVNSAGFANAVFDGRYIYLMQDSTYGLALGQITRYDTTASFTASSSYSFFDTTTVNANSKGFNGAVFDGRYIYLAPYYDGTNYHGQFTRYDTTGNFTTAASWSVFDTGTINSLSKGFQGAVFDGRYVYLVPSINGTAFGQVTRYDTTAVFTATSSYSFFDTTLVNSNSKGFSGAVFDGRYVYLVPANNGSPFGQVTKYDTTQSFSASSSWSVYDTAQANSNSTGFIGGVFDGRYVYLVPNYNGVYSGLVTRIRAWSGGVDSHPSVNQTATTKDLYLDSQGQIGLGTVLPSSRLTVVNGGIDVGNGSTTSSVSSTYFILGKTLTKASGTLYIDQSGSLFSSSTFTFSGTSSSTITGLGLVLRDSSAGQSSSKGFGLVIPGGYLCVSASSSNCIPSGGGSYASGSIYAEAYRSTSAADVAENFPSNDTLEPGDVVTFDLTQSEHLKKTTEANETLIAGVVSTKPGFILGSDGHNTYPLALTGRVPVKVTNENGTINIGDLLISASRPGYAMKYDQTKDTGAIIGVAVEALPPDQSEGKIIVFLRGTFTAPSTNTNQNATTLNIQTNTTESIITYNQDIDLTNHTLKNVQAILGTNHWSITADGSLIVEKIQTKDLQAESLTITATENERKTAGRGVISAGTTALVIPNKNIEDNAMIMVSIDTPSDIRWFVTDIISKQSFTLQLSDPLSNDTKFVYWVINNGSQ